VLRREENYSLDLLRGLSAVLVCLGHLWWAMFPLLSPAKAGLPARLLMLAMSQGHHAVLAFFVLSGYFVGGSILRSPVFRWRPYLLKRLVRLWAVLIPALAFAGVVGLAVVRLHPDVPADAFKIQGSWPGPYDFSLLTLACNLAFLQKIVSPVFANDGPLWSLSYEFWYYLLFPALLLAWRSGRLVLWAFVVALAAAGAASLSLDQIKESVEPFVAWFLVWMMGCGVYALERRRPQALKLGPWPTLALTAVLLACAMAPDQLLAAAHLWLPTKVQELGVGLAFAGVVYLRVANPALALPEALGRAGAFLSKFSYSLYLTHFPLVILIAFQCYPAAPREISLATLAAFLAWAALLLLNGWVFWWAFESRTDWVRGQVSRALGWNQ